MEPVGLQEISFIHARFLIVGPREILPFDPIGGGAGLTAWSTGCCCIAVHSKLNIVFRPHTAAVVVLFSHGLEQHHAILFLDGTLQLPLKILTVVVSVQLRTRDGAERRG